MKCTLRCTNHNLIYTVERILQEKDFIVLTSFRTNMEFTKKIFVFSVTLMAFIETTWKSLGEITHEDWIKACKHLKTTSFHKNMTVSSYCFHCLTVVILFAPHFLSTALTQCILTNNIAPLGRHNHILVGI